MAKQSRTSMPYQGQASEHECILVVDDEPHILQLLHAQLNALNYRVLTASDAPQSLEILNSGQQVDLLLTDASLNGTTNGPELIEMARKSHPELKVILCSGMDRQSIPGLQESLQGVSFLPKPYQLMELASLVRKTLDQV